MCHISFYDNVCCYRPGDTDKNDWMHNLGFDKKDPRLPDHCLGFNNAEEIPTKTIKSL